MPSKKEIFHAILAGAAAFIPGGPIVKEGIESLIHKNDDPTDDIDEIADAIGKIAVGAITAAEGVTEKDFVNDAAFLQAVANVTGAVKSLQFVAVKKAA